jgi:hypothetical protein
VIWRRCFGDGQLGVANDVDEQDVADFESQLRFFFLGHTGLQVVKIVPL